MLTSIVEEPRQNLNVDIQILDLSHHCQVSPMYSQPDFIKVMTAKMCQNRFRAAERSQNFTKRLKNFAGKATVHFLDGSPGARIPSSAAVGLADCYLVDILGVRYKLSTFKRKGACSHQIGESK